MQHTNDGGAVGIFSTYVAIMETVGQRKGIE